MDLLHQRYASPFSLLDEVIIQCQFNKWVERFLNKTAQEKDDTMLWEFFLHKIYDKSFAEWKAELNGKSPSSQQIAMDEANKEKIIKQSQNILNGFMPVQGKG